MGLLANHTLLIGAALAVIVAAIVLAGFVRDRRHKREYRLPVDSRRRGHDRPLQSWDTGADRSRDGWRDDDIDRFTARQEPDPPIPIRAAHLVARSGSGDAPVSPELAQLTVQVGSLEKQLNAGLGGLRRRIEQLEMRVEGQIDHGNDITPEGRDVDAMFTSSPGGALGYGGAADAVVSQPLSFAPGVGGDAGGGGARVAVELSGTEVLVTQSIPPEAWLVPQGGGRAQVSLNPEVPHNRFALDRLATFFELGDRREGAYITRAPAEVRWDDHEQRGVLVSPGKAVAR